MSNFLGSIFGMSLESNHTARLTAINNRKEETYGYLSHPIRRGAYPSHRLSDGVANKAA